MYHLDKTRILSEPHACSGGLVGQRVMIQLITVILDRILCPSPPQSPITPVHLPITRTDPLHSASVVSLAIAPSAPYAIGHTSPCTALLASLYAALLASPCAALLTSLCAALLPCAFSPSWDVTIGRVGS